jgi:hypothetical protein
MRPRAIDLAMQTEYEAASINREGDTRDEMPASVIAPAGYPCMEQLGSGAVERSDLVVADAKVVIREQSSGARRNDGGLAVGTSEGIDRLPRPPDGDDSDLGLGARFALEQMSRDVAVDGSKLRQNVLREVMFVVRPVGWRCASGPHAGNHDPFIMPDCWIAI